MNQKQLGHKSSAPQSFHERLYVALRINNFSNFENYDTTGLIKKRERQYKEKLKLIKNK